MIRMLSVLTIFTFLGAAPTLAVTFDHPFHMEVLEGAPCTTCHVEDAYSIVPEREVCLDCHEAEFAWEVDYAGLKTHGPVWAFNHRSQAKGESIDCSACHGQEYCLECHKSGFADEQGDFGNNMINIHRSDFQVSHPIAARTDPQLCSSCHENGFCVDCHDNFAPATLRIRSHRRGFSEGTLGGFHQFFTPQQCSNCHTDPETGLTVLPSDHWTSDHAREARRNLTACQACHPDGDVCLQCHSARNGLMVSPHPEDWDDIDGRLRRASDGRTCRRCH